VILPNESFEKKGNDIEHIFPRNPKEIKNKKNYIEFLNKYVTSKDAQFDLSGFDAKQEDEAFQKEVENYIQKQISDRVCFKNKTHA